jgi:hypothetical protein
MQQIVLHFVYGLTDPRFQGMTAVRYIGVSLNPNQRYQAHLACPQHDPVGKNAWIRSVQEEGLEPGIEIFEVVKAPKNDEAPALAREARWIEYYTKLGADLLNVQKNGTSSRKTVTIELSYALRLTPYKEYAEPEAKDVKPILEPGTVLEDGIVIEQLEDNLFDLLLRQGGFGTE